MVIRADLFDEAEGTHGAEGGRFAFAVEGFKHLTTAHGIHHVIHSRRKWKKVVWAIIGLSSFAFMIYNTELQVMKYLSFSPAVSVTVNSQVKMTFPAVTVCNNNPAMNSKLQENAVLNALMNGASSSSSSSSSSTVSNSVNLATASVVSSTVNPASVVSVNVNSIGSGSSSSVNSSISSNSNSITSTAGSAGNLMTSVNAAASTLAASVLTTTASAARASAMGVTTATATGVTVAGSIGSTISSNSWTATSSSTSSNTASFGSTVSSVLQSPGSASGSGTGSYSTVSIGASASGSASSTAATGGGGGGGGGAVVSAAAAASDGSAYGSADSQAGSVATTPSSSSSSCQSSSGGAMQYGQTAGIPARNQNSGVPAPPGSGGAAVRTSFELQLKVQSALSKMPTAEKAALGHQIADLIIDCEYAGSTCYPSSQFTSFYNGWYGNCYTFNSGWNSSIELKTAYRTGPQYGLSLIFNVDQDEYVGDLTEAAGIRVVVHDQSEMPFPETKGIAVSPGQLTYIGVTKSQNTRIGSPYDACTDPSQSNTDLDVYEELYPSVSYSELSCSQTCLQKYITYYCGCGDSQYPLNGTALGGSYEPCDLTNTTQVNCMNNITEQYQEQQLQCQCLPSCNSSSFYSIYSTMLWPADNYKSTAYENLASVSDLVKAIVNQDCDTDKFSRNVGKVVVYLQTFEYESIDESPAYELATLFCDIGGILGLYIGFSVLTIVEFFDFLFEFLWIIVSKPHPRQKVSTVPSKPRQDELNVGYPVGQHGPGAHSPPPTYYDQILKGGTNTSDSMGKKQMAEVVC